MSPTIADFLGLPDDVQKALDVHGYSIGYRDVSHTQLSIARHSGGTTINGKRFTYIPETDELIRDDVLKAIKKHAETA